MITVMRSYLGIRLPRSLQPILQQAQLELRRRMPSEPIRWYAPEEMALILAVLGEHEPETLFKVASAVAPVCSRYMPFTLTLQGYTGIPNGVMPKQVALSLGGDVEAVTEFQADLANAYSPYVPPREKVYAPHILLGFLRVESDQKRSTVGQMMRHLKPDPLATFTMSQLEVLRTDANDTQGVRYLSLMEIPLGLPGG